MADANGKHLDNPRANDRDPFIYLIFVSSIQDLPACEIAQCPCIARARYEDVVSAVFSGDPHTVARLFHKYDADMAAPWLNPWTQPGTGDSPDLSIGGGKFSPLYQGAGLNMVVYDRAFDVYLGVVNAHTGNAHAGNVIAGFQIRTSTDLIHWSDPIGPLITDTDDKRGLSYVTLLGETGDPTIAGKEPRLYFRSTAEGKSGWEDWAFKMVRLKLSKR